MVTISTSLTSFVSQTSSWGIAWCVLLGESVSCSYQLVTCTGSTTLYWPTNRLDGVTYIVWPVQCMVSDTCSTSITHRVADSLCPVNVPYDCHYSVASSLLQVMLESLAADGSSTKMSELPIRSVTTTIPLPDTAPPNLYLSVYGDSLAPYPLYTTLYQCGPAPNLTYTII